MSINVTNTYLEVKNTSLKDVDEEISKGNLLKLDWKLKYIYYIENIIQSKLALTNINIVIDL